MQKLDLFGALFAATLVTGVWAGNRGKPLKARMLGIHKLVALTWVIYGGILIYQLGSPVEASRVYRAVMAALTVSAVTLIATGSILTISNEAGNTWLNLHRAASVLAFFATGVVTRLLGPHQT